MAKVTNLGPNPRMIYNARNRMVLIPPGESVDVEVNEAVAQRLALNSRLRVDGFAGPPAAPVAQRRETPRAAEPVTHPEAQKLLDDFGHQRIKFFAFAKKAEELLGDKWPGGRPKKDEIVELLRSMTP